MLSKREKEVLRLIAAGATDAEAAGRLGVSKSTVQTHIYTDILYMSPGSADKRTAEVCIMFWPWSFPC